MEKIQVLKNNSSSKKFDKRPSSLVWDCESTLYDSFELNSFRKSLDSAITARTLSMPHLSSTDHDRRHRRHSSSSFDDPLPPLPPPPLKSAAVSTKSKNRAYKLTRSVRKLWKSVFKTNKTVNCNYSSTSSGSPKSWDGNNNTKKQDGIERRRDDRFFVVCDKSSVLKTIPEGPEVDHCVTSRVFSPEIGSFVRRTASDRFLFCSPLLYFVEFGAILDETKEAKHNFGAKMEQGKPWRTQE